VSGSFSQELLGAAWLAGERQARPLSLRLLVRPRLGPWAARGALRVGDWLDGAAVSGRLLPCPRRGPALTYELGFVDPGEGPLELVAHLRPRWVNPVASLTTLEGSVRAGSRREVARVLLRWDLRRGVAAGLLGLAWRRLGP